VIVGVLKFITFIKESGIENEIDLLVNEPADMSVSQLCRVTFGFTRNGFNAKLINLTIGYRRENHTVAELLKEGCPERIIFVHVKHTWNADRATCGFFGRKRFITEDSL